MVDVGFRWFYLRIDALFYGSGKSGLLPRLSASLEGEDIDKLFVITMGLIIVVQFITQFLIYYFTFKYRGIKGERQFFMQTVINLKCGGRLHLQLFYRY